MLLIITGCVQVDSAMQYVAVRNTELRLKDYISTILWALEGENFEKVIFCDNSGFCYDSTKLKKIAASKSKQFEWLSFKENRNLANELGKGYGEGEIIKYALKNSSIISSSDKFLCKITGRLKITNIDGLIKKNKNCFMKKHFSNEIDTRFYYVSIYTYKKYLMDAHERVNDSKKKYLEHVFYDALKQNNIKYSMFYKRPLFVGISGSTGRKYQDERKNTEIVTDILCRCNLYNNEKLWYMISRFKNTGEKN